ncbi:MAG: hypothetical protein DMD60_11540, partial [Gemmatimonadetes bacterium]
MPSIHAHTLVTLLLSVVAACSHHATGDGKTEAAAPAATSPRSTLTEEDIAHSSGRPIEQLLM